MKYKIVIVNVKRDFIGRIEACGRIVGEFGQITQFSYATKSRSRRVVRTNLKENLHFLAERYFGKEATRI